MQKSSFIILGVIILLLGIGIWIYLLVYGAPKNTGDVFGNFSFGDNGNNLPPPSSEGDSEETSDSERVPALRQLTTRPVAGAVFVPGAIRYVERGTGHIYEIDLPQGEERLISNTTIPQTIGADFSSEGNRVIITTERNEHNESILGLLSTSTIEDGVLQGVALPPEATNVGWGKEENTLYYALPSETGSSAFAYDVNTGVSTNLFSIPLRDVVIRWGTPTYIYTTPTARQTGYLYLLEGNNLTYTVAGERGLMALPLKESLLVTKSTNGALNSAIIKNYTETQPLPVPFYPEKCASSENSETLIYCGASIGTSVGEFPDDWYKGEMSYIDSLWKVDTETGDTALLSSLLSESGREIDISSIGVSMGSEYIYFTNKNDGTLWLFDMTI